MEIMVDPNCTAVVRKVPCESPSPCPCCGTLISRSRTQVSTDKVQLGDLAFQCVCGERRHIQHYEVVDGQICPGKRECPNPKCRTLVRGPMAFREVKSRAA